MKPSPFWKDFRGEELFYPLPANLPGNATPLQHSRAGVTETKLPNPAASFTSILSTLLSPEPFQAHGSVALHRGTNTDASSAQPCSYRLKTKAVYDELHRVNCVRNRRLTCFWPCPKLPALGTGLVYII